jgi:hypothetical protein
MVPLINSPISWTFGMTPRVDNTMFQKDLLKDWHVSYLFNCSWYLDYLKDNTPTLGIPLREIIESSFMETLGSFAGT